MIKGYKSPDTRLNSDILHHQIIYLNSELNKYKTKVREYQEDYHYSQLEKLKNENRQLLKEQQQYINQMKEMNHKNRNLQNMILEKESLIEQLKEQNKNIKQEITAVNNKLAQVISNNEKNLKDIEKLKHTNQQLQHKVFSLEKELILRNEQYAQSEKAIQELQHSNGILSEENKKLIADTLDHKEEIKIMLDEATHLQNQIITQNQKLNEHHDIQLNNKTEIQTLKDLNKRLKDEQIQLKEEKQTLESFQNEMFDRIEELKTEILSISSSEMTGSPIQHKNIEYTKLYQQVEHILSKINEDDEKISSCMKLTDHLEQHIDQLTDEIKQLKGTLPTNSPHQ